MMSSIYDINCEIKPEVRSILWEYERNKNLAKSVESMEMLFIIIYNQAIEEAAKVIDDVSCGQVDEFYIYDCQEHAKNIRKLKR